MCSSTSDIELKTTEGYKTIIFLQISITKVDNQLFLNMFTADVAKRKLVL